MCIASLSASTLPCQHRWYALLSPCTPGLDLSNCPSRLQISGWEQKSDACPWCSQPDSASPGRRPEPNQTEAGKYLLLGTGRRRSSNAPSPGSSRANSTGSGGIAFGREGRANSTGSTGSNIPLSLGERNRLQNLRIESYLGYGMELIAQANRKAEDDTEYSTPLSRTTSGGSAGTSSEEDARNNKDGRWKKVRKMSRGWFK